jgi:polyhydroxyalkanoate synthesis regulator phasin
MSFKSNFKHQIESISSRVLDAEKAAEKQIRAVLKSSEHLRDKQLKNVQMLMKRAKALRQTDIAKRAEKVAKEIEGRAATGLEILLSKLNVPSRAEVDRLNKKISALQKRLDQSEKTSSKN